MAMWRKLCCHQKWTKSGCQKIIKNLKNRIFSELAAYKFIQLIVASTGMGLHICQPSYKNAADCTVLPAVLGAFNAISGVLLFGHLCNFTAPMRLNATFSIVAVLGYGWCMNIIMDTVRIEGETTTWNFALCKGIVCFVALAIHLLELLQTFITRDTRPVNLRSSGPSQSLSRSESNQAI